MNLPTYTPQALYHLASFLYPEEMAPGDFLPIEIQGVPVELRCETHRGDGMDMEFVLRYPGDAHPARITTVYLCGSINDEIVESAGGVGPIGPVVDTDKSELLPLIFSLLLLHQLRRVVNAQLTSPSPTTQNPR